MVPINNCSDVLSSLFYRGLGVCSNHIIAGSFCLEIRVDQMLESDCCCCLPTHLTFTSEGGSSIFPLLRPSGQQCALTPAVYVHKFRGNNVLRMWVQLKR